jgi:hypothetical protein
MTLKRFGSQTVNIDELEGYLYTHLEECWYKAGKTLGWKGNSTGIGIAKDIVDYAASKWLNIAVTVGSNPHWFIFDAEEWKKICEANKWIYQVDHDKIIYVLPWSMLKKV